LRALRACFLKSGSGSDRSARTPAAEDCEQATILALILQMTRPDLAKKVIGFNRRLKYPGPFRSLSFRVRVYVFPGSKRCACRCALEQPCSVLFYPCQCQRLSRSLLPRKATCCWCVIAKAHLNASTHGVLDSRNHPSLAQNKVTRFSCSPLMRSFTLRQLLRLFPCRFALFPVLQP
jgi:hypothetical protein